MERKMFGHRMRKRSEEDVSRGPGEGQSFRSTTEDDKDNPPGYEGREHVKYKDPGFSRHEIKYPEDEPHMKSHVSKEEMHEMEDDFHMDVPDQTEDTLEKKIKRARMLMDAKNQQNPKPIRGNPVHNVPYRGEEDTSGEEEEGPNDMQEEGNMSKSKKHRKKMIVAVMKRKMNKMK